MKRSNGDFPYKLQRCVKCVLTVNWYLQYVLTLPTLLAQRHSAESCAYCQTRKINLHIQGQILLQGNAIYRLGGREKAAVRKYRLQVLRSFRFLQVRTTDWGIRSCGTY